jgi:ABC-type uncharacterized transport system involved in gliding motility auxiliary subunit
VNIRLLKARQTKYAAYATVYTLVVLLIVVIANVLADRHNKSFDATANKRYSLSPQTAKIVKELKQDADITYFDQPGGFEHAKDLLQQYANLSSKVHVKYVDAVKQPMVARAAGVTHDGATTFVQIGPRKEEAKSFTEEGITGAFIRDLKNTTRTVCFITGSGEHRIEDSDRAGYSDFKDLLGKDEYATQSLDLLHKTEIPTDCTVLVLAGPTKDYQQSQVDAITRYVEGGGRALFLIDPPFKFGKGDVADNEALTSVLQSWGVTLAKNLVLDRIGQLAGLGAQVAVVTSEGYANHPIVNEIKDTATGFPLARSLEIKSADKTNVDKLFSSSPVSFATSNLRSPEIDPTDPKNQKGPMLLGAAGTYKTGKENSQGRFVVVGDSNWASNSFIEFKGNPDLALNMVNWLASDEDLISIRPKDQDDRRITMTRSQFSMVLMTSQFLVPFAVVVAGVSVWWKRR